MECPGCAGDGVREHDRSERTGGSRWAIITYKVIKDIGRHRADGGEDGGGARRRRATGEEPPGDGRAGKTDRLGNATFT